MNKCFNEFPVCRTEYRNRRYVASYSRRTRSRSAFSILAERLLALCMGIVDIFENSAARVAVKIASLTALFVGFFLLVAAIEGGSIGFIRAVLSAFGLVGGFALAIRI